jgi:hypothetical protein
MKVPAKKAPARKLPAKNNLEMFPKGRVCIHCGVRTAGRFTRLIDDPLILTIAMQLYRRPLGYDSQHRAAPVVTLCEKCTVRAITGSPKELRAEAVTLLNALRERLAGVYNAMLEANQQ